MTRLTRIMDWVGERLAVVSGSCVVIMMVLIFVNIVLRLTWQAWGPVPEIVGWLGVLTAGFSLVYSQTKKHHVVIDMVTSRFPPRLRKVIVGIGLVVAAVLFGLVSWQVGVLMYNTLGGGVSPMRVSNTLRIPYWWVVGLLAIGVGLFAIKVLLDGLSTLRSAFIRSNGLVERDEGGRTR